MWVRTEYGEFVNLDHALRLAVEGSILKACLANGDRVSLAANAGEGLRLIEESFAKGQHYLDLLSHFATTLPSPDGSGPGRQRRERSRTL